MVKCSKCLVEKDESEFHPSQIGRTYSVCKQCLQAYYKTRKFSVSVTEKRCSVCGNTKPASEFYRKCTLSDGLSAHCKACQKAKKESVKLKPKRVIVEKTCSMCQNLLSIDKFGINNTITDGYNCACKDCLKAIRDTEEFREKDRIRSRKRVEDDLSFRINRSIRGRIGAAVGRRLSGAKYIGSTCEILLGCTVPQFISYLETTFKEGMSWENYGKSGWHIDHIKPLSSFDLTNDIECMKAFHYTNCQALWAYENLSKGCRT